MLRRAPERLSYPLSECLDSTLKYLRTSWIQTRNFSAERQPKKVVQPLKRYHLIRLSERRPIRQLCKVTLMVGENSLIPLEKHRPQRCRFVLLLPLCEPEPTGERKKPRSGNFVLEGLFCSVRNDVHPIALEETSTFEKTASSVQLSKVEVEQ
jgi:hypothetical protein